MGFRPIIKLFLTLLVLGLSVLLALWYITSVYGSTPRTGRVSIWDDPPRSRIKTDDSASSTTGGTSSKHLDYDQAERNEDTLERMARSRKKNQRKKLKRKRLKGGDTINWNRKGLKDKIEISSMDIKTKLVEYAKEVTNSHPTATPKEITSLHLTTLAVTQKPTNEGATSTTPAYIAPTKYIYGDTNCSPNPWRPVLFELFKEWVKMAAKHKIEYILYAGTQLGQLRNQDIIPYDSDMDLLMDVNFFPKMKEIAVKRDFNNTDGKMRLVIQPEFDLDIPSTSRKRYKCDGGVTPSMVDQCSFQEPLGRLIKGEGHIDFYHFYDRGKTIDDPSEEDDKVYQKTDLYPLRTCMFMGVNSTCPNHPFELLKAYFHHDRFMEPDRKCKGGEWVRS
ncbi:uncharacterized protein LOC116611341 [Nematostella vectensis]|uniref:uncharacterized protein LOC116611341 n=1 Tax=Nematostella vectensis TaxID=45351 RepID=UPI0013901C88|nr:uncharacterized protein LOC116611341 [Nematostella vectensis]